MRRTVLGELLAVGVIGAGVLSVFGAGWSMIITGSLILAGIELYGMEPRGEDNESS